MLGTLHAWRDKKRNHSICRSVVCFLFLWRNQCEIIQWIQVHCQKMFGIHIGGWDLKLKHKRFVYFQKKLKRFTDLAVLLHYLASLWGSSMCFKKRSRSDNLCHRDAITHHHQVKNWNLKYCAFHSSTIKTNTIPYIPICRSALCSVTAC